jgi:glycosyltransferase involved in cell wall biosynthesis
LQAAADRRLQTLGIPAAERFPYRPAVTPLSWLPLLELVRRQPIHALQAEFPAAVRPLARISRWLRIPLIYAAHNIEYLRMQDLYPELSSAQLSWMKDVEAFACRESHITTAVSEIEVRELRQQFCPAATSLFPNGVRSAAFEYEPQVDLRSLLSLPPEVFLLMFHGELNYPPNREAFDILCSAVMPSLSRAGLDCRLIVLGRGSDCLPLHPQVCTLGEVDDPLPYLRNADVAVLPLRSGRGTRIKVLEYLACGVPLVATAKAVEGLELSDRVQLRIEENVEEMVGAVRDILLEARGLPRMSGTARTFARQYSWEQVVKRATEELYLPLLK